MRHKNETQFLNKNVLCNKHHIVSLLKIRPKRLMSVMLEKAALIREKDLVGSGPG
jgi:hypothetical protein